jgi:hypothetical protein
VKWKVKLGDEAKPETVASRLVWAVGYFADEDYFVPELRVKEMPTRLHRGHKFVSADGVAHDARLKRDNSNQKKVGIWSWFDDPFTGTRELNGLRVLMAVIDNWDLKDENNSVLAVNTPGGARSVYLVSDLGASFGPTGFGWTRSKSRGNLKAYERAKWIREVTPYYVDFNVPSRPAVDHLPYVRQYSMRLHLREIGRKIPRQDVKWMAGLLGRLSGRQIRDAFRAAGYDAQYTEAFSRELEERIATLKAL